LAPIPSRSDTKSGGRRPSRRKIRPSSPTSPETPARSGRYVSRQSGRGD